MFPLGLSVIHHGTMVPVIITARIPCQQRQLHKSPSTLQSLSETVSKGVDDFLLRPTVEAQKACKLNLLAERLKF